MTGWHYTPTHNLPSIHRHGLKPSPLEGHDCGEYAEQGVWIYLQKPFGRAHHGTIIHRAIRHNTDSITLLRVNLTDTRIIGHRLGHKDKPRFFHTGYLEDRNGDKWIYHYGDDTDEFVIIPETIHPKHITEHQTFNLNKLLAIQ